MVASRVLAPAREHLVGPRDVEALPELLHEAPVRLVHDAVCRADNRRGARAEDLVP